MNTRSLVCKEDGILNNVMLITGANKGIGYYMVKSWIEKGNKSIVLDINCDEIDKLKEQYYNHLMTFICDVSDEKSVQECIEKAINNYKTVDIAVHNACICVFEDVENHSIQEYNRIYEVNFLGAVNITKAVLPYMKKQGKGRICYTSSGVGVTGYINISGYSASKGAIEAFVKCMIMENLENDISFHILQPPLTNTESSSPLPVPEEFKADPQKVGYGFMKRIFKRSFVIAPSFIDGISVKMSYCFPRLMGKLLVKMTNRIK